MNCTVEGCESPAYVRGLCVMHYDRLLTIGDVGPAGRLRGPRGSGHVDRNGYRVVRVPAHPLARAQGKLFEHRLVLFDKIGPGVHPCNWCARPVSWDGEGLERLVADHVDEDRLHNAPENLVPSCIPCNTHREAVA